MISSINNPAVESTGDKESAGLPAVYPLEFREVWFSYGEQPVVEDVNFAVTAGEFVALLGPNGSGKTTLLRLALGLVSPTRGEVRLFGKNPTRFADWGEVGYVPQQVEALQSRFPATVREVVGFGQYSGFDLLRLFKIGSRRRNHAAVDDAMGRAGVFDLASRRISDLSVGQQQRILIAQALVRQPSLLLMDEPVAGVDAAGTEQFHALLRELNKDLGITIVMVSHDIGAVMREATTCACSKRVIVFHGPVHNLTRGDLSRLNGFPVDILMHDHDHTHR